MTGHQRDHWRDWHHGRHGRHRPLLVAVLLAALALSGCVSLPTSGPLVTSRHVGSDTQPEAIDIAPLGPQHDAGPSEIAGGFLDAMLETPVRSDVAREFLTRASARSWQPSMRTITYQTHSVPSGGASVEVALDGADQLNGRGAWQGSLEPGGGSYQLRFSLVREHGQWRISDPPDALIVPQEWFAERFRQVSLYFFDPTGTVLVPEPVFVPTGTQLASSLISGLLAGPPADLRDSSLDPLPPGLHVALSVPVSKDGTAQVQLSGSGAADVGASARQAALLVGQLAWTLRQDSRISSLRVSIGGQPVQIGRQTRFPVEMGEQYAPYVAGSGTLLYGLLDGRLVSGSAQNLDPVPGLFGAGDYAPRSAVPDLLADRAAAVSTSGTSLLEGSIRSGGGPVTTVLSGARDLLRPAWDFSGRVWDVDRRPHGAVVDHVDRDGAVGTLEVPGVSGQDVKTFLVSRDGSRLVAVVHDGPGDDRIVVARILHDAAGQVVRAIDERTVAEEDAPAHVVIRAVAWSSPTTLAVLHPVGTALFQVRTVDVDGAPSGPDALTVTLPGHFSGLAGTPSPDQAVYAVGRGRLEDLSGNRAGQLDIDPDVTALTYPG